MIDDVPSDQTEGEQVAHARAVELAAILLVTLERLADVNTRNFEHVCRDFTRSGISRPQLEGFVDADGLPALLQLLKVT